MLLGWKAESEGEMAEGLEKILQDVRSLQPDERDQLLKLLNREKATAEREARSRAIKRIQGKYAHLLPSTEEFLNRKREEVELEDRP